MQNKKTFTKDAGKTWPVRLPFWQMPPLRQASHHTFTHRSYVVFHLFILLHAQKRVYVRVELSSSSSSCVVAAAASRNILAFSHRCLQAIFFFIILKNKKIVSDSNLKLCTHCTLFPISRKINPCLPSRIAWAQLGAHAHNISTTLVLVPDVWCWSLW